MSWSKRAYWRGRPARKQKISWAARRFSLIALQLVKISATGRPTRIPSFAEGRRRTPILVLSANVMRSHVEASAAAGADGHLGKPFRADVLISTVIRVTQGEAGPFVAAA